MSSKLSSAMSQKKKKFVPGKDWVWYAPNTHDVFGEPEIKAGTTSLRGGWLTTGKNTALFESKISKIFGKKYGLFVNSGSSANLLALEILRLPKGAEVITPACNFIDLPRIRAFAKKNKLVFVEDSCDTIGGTFQGKPSGAWSDITITSFYA